MFARYAAAACPSAAPVPVHPAEIPRDAALQTWSKNDALAMRPRAARTSESARDLVTVEKAELSDTSARCWTNQNSSEAVRRTLSTLFRRRFSHHNRSPIAEPKSLKLPLAGHKQPGNSVGENSGRPARAGTTSVLSKATSKPMFANPQQTLEQAAHGEGPERLLKVQRSHATRSGPRRRREVQKSLPDWIYLNTWDSSRTDVRKGPGGLNVHLAQRRPHVTELLNYFSCGQHKGILCKSGAYASGN